ncbi:MAG: MobF family relaxase [Candidatus Dormibacteria bacterium]
MSQHKIGAPAVAGYADYLLGGDRDRRPGDYYLGREGTPLAAPGRWHGRGASALGLTRKVGLGEVDRGDLLRVWEGIDPTTGEVLVRRGSAGEHVAGVDITFSAPKSVSVIWADAAESVRIDLEVAQTLAVEVALAHLEDHAPVVRRRVDGEIRHELAEGLVVARFRHHTARLTGEQLKRGGAPDPQLHDHCVVANLALRREGAEAADGRWGAVDSRELFRLTQEGDAVYLAQLAAELMSLGYPIERRGRYFEIAGVRPELIDRFSSRDREVAEAVRNFSHRHGRRPSNEELRVLVIASRQPGSKHTDGTGAIDSEWRAALRPEGRDRFGLDRVRRPEPIPRPDRDSAVQDILHELTFPLDDRCLTTRSAVFDNGQLRNTVGQACHGRVAGEHLDSVVAAVAASPELIRLDDQHWSTRDMVETERAALASAAERMRHRQPALDPALLDLAFLASRVPLSEEQRQAAERLCGPERIALLTAPAGAGKGEVLRAIADAHILSRRRVIAVAAAGETAQRLGLDIRADHVATVESFTYGFLTSGRHEAGLGDVIVVDEGALLETWRWRRLLEAAGDAKVVAAGDPGQLLPIEAGGLWPVLADRVPSVELHDNHRAREEWAKDAWEALRQGRAPEALSALDERGQVLLAHDRAGARAAAVELWHRRRQEIHGADVSDHLLLTDGSNHDVDELNRMAQHHRRDAGEVTGPSVHVLARDSKRGTEREEDLMIGDLVVFERQAYLRDQAGRSLPRVENGERGLVVDADPEDGRLTVRLPLREVTVDTDHLDALRLGYAQHVYSDQGRTVDEVYAVIGGWQTTERSAYVGISRARDASWVVSDYSSLEATPGDRAGALGELSERCRQASEKVAAVSLLEGAGGNTGWQRMLTDVRSLGAEIGSDQRSWEVEQSAIRATSARPINLLAEVEAIEIESLASPDIEVELSW